MSETLIILGASARAAAFSARAAGFSPACADLFADVDLAQQAKALKVRDYPQGLVAAARRLPPGPWMYTGALENHSELVDRLAQQRPLLGNRGDVLRRVRDPFALRHEIKTCGLELPPIRRTSDSLPRDGSWLRKPYRGSGGSHIVPWTEDSAASDAEEHQPPERYFFQERKHGVPYAAVFVAATGRSSLLGVTRQIIGASWAGARGFRYAGSIGPHRTTNVQQARLQEAGNRIAERFHLTGLFGIDFLCTEDELWLIEINPRYPASAEVLERAFDLSVVGAHVAACTRGILYSDAQRPSRCSGKAILFAEHDLTISSSFVAWARAQNNGFERYVVADLPQQGTSIPAGAPIATVVADGDDANDVEDQLQRRAEELKTSLCSQVSPM